MNQAIYLYIYLSIYLSIYLGKSKEDDNTLLKPIVSLFSVAAFIVILGSLRSCYVKPKVRCSRQCWGEGARSRGLRS